MSDEKIPHYINNPSINAATAPELKLYRPVINYWNAIVFTVSHFLVSFIFTILYHTLFQKQRFSETEIFILFTLILFTMSLRFTLIWFIRLYQHFAKSETRLRCCMVPSCSEYAVLVVKRYGAIIGGIKTIKRLLNCHPPGGVDYPEFWKRTK